MIRSLAIFLCIISMWACEQSASTTLISPEVQYSSDTLVARMKSSFKADLDSICQLTKVEKIAVAVDSLYQLELLKIGRLKNE